MTTPVAAPPQIPVDRPHRLVRWIAAVLLAAAIAVGVLLAVQRTSSTSENASSVPAPASAPQADQPAATFDEAARARIAEQHDSRIEQLRRERVLQP